MSYKSGAQYRVQIDTVVRADGDGTLWTAGGRYIVSPRALDHLNATVTEVVPPEPPEPPLGSIWRVGFPHSALIERAYAGRGPGWWNHTTRCQMTWDEVRALPGGLIYTPDTTGGAG